MMLLLRCIEVFVAIGAFRYDSRKQHAGQYGLPGMLMQPMLCACADL